MNKTKEEYAVLETLAYYMAMANLALTPLEIKKYIRQKEANLSLFEIHNALASLEKKRLTHENRGFWSPNIKNTAIPDRLKHAKTSAFKWKKFSETAGFLPYVPYVRKVDVTGSVALNNSTPESDIDILITAERDRIWLVRFLITIYSWVSGIRRYGKKVTDRLCFNHYITVDSAASGPYNIDTVVQNIKVTVWDEKETRHNNTSIHHIKTSKAGIWLKRALETALNITFMGHALEKSLGIMQIAKIKKNSTQYPEELGPLTVESKQLIFYYPKVRDTERRYKEIIRSI
ncbi:MAG: nucleotidyltransferase domain-containing protein [Candidatus Spechtbacterales bacterium]